MQTRKKVRHSFGWLPKIIGPAPFCTSTILAAMSKEPGPPLLFVSRVVSSPPTLSVVAPCTKELPLCLSLRWRVLLALPPFSRAECIAKLHGQVQPQPRHFPTQRVQRENNRPPPPPHLLLCLH
ncbi:unnamed protein product, partial [Ectocarpus sp. 12 AP-2014]